MDPPAESWIAIPVGDATTNTRHRSRPVSVYSLKVGAISPGDAKDLHRKASTLERYFHLLRLRNGSVSSASPYKRARLARPATRRSVSIGANFDCSTSSSRDPAGTKGASPGMTHRRDPLLPVIVDRSADTREPPLPTLCMKLPGNCLGSLRRITLADHLGSLVALGQTPHRVDSPHWVGVSVI